MAQEVLYRIQQKGDSLFVVHKLFDTNVDVIMEGGPNTVTVKGSPFVWYTTYRIAKRTAVDMQVARLMEIKANVSALKLLRSHMTKNDKQ